MKYSASDLVKRSAAQIVYLRYRAEAALSRRALLGEQYQSKIVKGESLSNVVADEMRGCYTYDGDEIFFCIDMIKNGEFFEIKSVQDKDGNETDIYPEWYLNNLLLQCAFYKSLILNMNGSTLYTPKFRLKEGFKKAHIEINKSASYYLIFGSVGMFKVDVIDPKKIISFYENKIDHCTDYEMARKYDTEYKRKEFELLSPFFQYQTCNKKL